MSKEPTRPTRSLISRVTSATTEISELLEISGAPSLSYAVIHQGCLIHTRHLGYRDIEANLPPDNDTRHNINSMTKALTAALVAMEVAKGTLMWSSKFTHFLPDFKSRSPTVKQECTILDLLTHNTGLSECDALWLGSQNNIILDRVELLRTIATLLPGTPFRSETFIYNNWGYEIVGLVLKKVTGKGISQLLMERIFEPLKLSRTSTSWNEEDDNEAVAYAVLDDLSTVKIESPKVGHGTLMEAAGGVKSTLNDLIILYTEMLSAISTAFNPSCSSTETPNVFHDCTSTFTAHRVIPGESLREQTYAMGWCRAQLPGQIGRIANNAILSTPPVIGTDTPPCLIIYHHGSIPGGATVVNLLPETRSAVNVLQNSSTPVDIADYAAQLLIERLLNVPEPVDFVALAREHVRKAFKQASDVKVELDRNRQLGTFPKALASYVGRYLNELRNWCIDVSINDDGGLTMAFQGLDTEIFELRHYHHDSFEWWMSWNEGMRRARVAVTTPSFWLIDFGIENGRASRLMWAMDPAISESKEIFYFDKES
ncbi:Nn.00g078970.m01.CDS01 [Neocucurbitaria sp. VM-36]